MRALSRLYTLTVLWLLSVVAKNAAGIIYDFGHADGANALREEMRAELVKLHAASSTERMRAYDRGFADALHLYDDEADLTALPGEQVH
jgi:hypothetical protein